LESNDSSLIKIGVRLWKVVTVSDGEKKKEAKEEEKGRSGWHEKCFKTGVGSIAMK